MPELLEIEQRTDEWYQARLGKATASRFKDVLTTIKSGESAARRNYKAELVVERLTNQQIERYSNKFMEWGVETEELAKVEYSLKTGNIVDEASFYVHKKLEAGASPDGLIDKDGLIEIKCRQIANHIAALKSDEVPAEYIPQIQGQLWITERKWCDFISFVPEMPANAQLFIKRVPRDNSYIKMLEGAVKVFLEEVGADVNFVEKYKR